MVTESAKDDPQAEKVLRALCAVLDGSLGNFELEYPCHDADHRRWFRCLLSPLSHLPDGRAGAVMVLHIDNTEVHLAQEAAQAAAEAKANFLATMSHEIRTPINTLLGAAQLLQLTELSPRQEDLLRLMMRSGQALDGLLKDVLDLSRIEAGRMELEMRPFSPAQLVRETLDLVRIRAAEKGIDTVCDIDASLPALVSGDAARLRQVLLNLLGNAVKFTQRGHVRLTVGMAGDRIQITVSDTGIGISAAVLDKLFQPFVQGDSSIARSFGGSGLGLSICKRLIEAMDGTISLGSEEGVGTTAHISFLAVPAEGTFTVPSGRTVSAASPLRLLLVEDEPAGRDIMASLLASLGHSVIQAEDAYVALRQVAEGSFDAAVVDIQLPGLDGIALTRMLKSLWAPDALPVLALTANVNAEDRRVYERSGFDAVLGKPVLVEDLAQALGAFARTRSASARPALLDYKMLERILLDVGRSKVVGIVHNTRLTVDGALAELAARPPLSTLSAIAHKLKGCSAMVGLPWLHAIAQLTEEASQAGRAQDAEDGRVLCLVWGTASMEKLEAWLELKPG